MRKVLPLLALLLTAASFGGRAKTFTDSTRDHQLWITATPQGDGAEYDVRLVERKTNYPVAQFRATAASGSPADVTNDDLKVHLEPSAEGLRAKVDLTRDAKVVDSFDIWWDTTGPESPVSDEGTQRVGGDVKAPTVLSRVDPIYTDAAKQERIAGIVILETLIDHTGVVRKIRVLKKLPYGLADSAVDALRQWKFAPGTREGQPVDVVFNMTIQFKA